MRTTPLWQQSGDYSAKADRTLMAALWPGGGTTGAVVTAVNNTMDVSVSPGLAAVPLQAGQGSALCHWDAAEVVTLAAAPPSGQTRVDLIVAQVRDTDYDGGANNDFVITVVGGVPATMDAAQRPGAESTEDDDDGATVDSFSAVPVVPPNAVALAEVTVPGAAANLNGDHC